MRHHTLQLLITCSLLVLGGCRMTETKPNKSAVGDPYDMFIICDNDAWADRNLSLTVCDLFEEDVPGMKRHEGYFNIVKQADPDKVTEIDYKSSNIFRVSIDPTFTSPTTGVTTDVYGYPQTIVTVHAPSTAVAAEYIRLSAPELRYIFEQAERDRRVSEVRSSHDKTLSTEFEEHTGYNMLIPKGYQKAGTRDKELLWYILNGEKMARYIFAFSYDYTSEWDLTAEGITMQTDAMLTTIPGEAEHSFMKIDERGPAILTKRNIAGRLWYEVRGWWDVANDYMGGIYASYTTLDEATQRLTTILFGVYAPDEGSHLEYIRGMEHLIFTIK
ncbi:MAG: DUF4837 family protein [Alistipes sp.]|nr:DUF4837 family protein [Alistipes sp.]